MMGDSVHLPAISQRRHLLARPGRLPSVSAPGEGAGAQCMSALQAAGKMGGREGGREDSFSFPSSLAAMHLPFSSLSSFSANPINKLKRGWSAAI